MREGELRGGGNKSLVHESVEQLLSLNESVSPVGK